MGGFVRRDSPWREPRGERRAAASPFVAVERIAAKRCHRRSAGTCPATPDRRGMVDVAPGGGDRGRGVVDHCRRHRLPTQPPRRRV